MTGSSATTGDLSGRRIAVIGTTGTGKTTLARSLAQKHGLTHIELDSLFWQPGWKPIEMGEFRSLVADAVEADRWVSDGNYRGVRDIVWSQADIILWLDYSLLLVFWRLFKRNIKQIIERQVLWGTNQVTIRNAFFCRDSLFFWAAQTYRRRRREYPELFQMKEYRHIKVFHFTSPRMTDDWFERVS